MSLEHVVLPYNTSPKELHVQKCAFSNERG